MNRLQKIIFTLGILAIGGMFFSAIMGQVSRNVIRMKASKSFTENDFISMNYVVAEIWQRTIERKDMPGSKQSYLYIKVEGEPFNLSFGYKATDMGEHTAFNDSLARYLKEGKMISVKVNKNDLEYAQENGILRKINDFFSGSNKEVEIYSLDVAGKHVYEQDIKTPTFANRSFADVATEYNLLYLGFAIAVLYGLIYWIPKFFRSKNLDVNSEL